MMICEKCKNEHDGTYGSGRFCNSKCARSFSTVAKRDEINKRVSEKVSGRPNGRAGKKIGPLSEAHKRAISEGHKRILQDPTRRDAHIEKLRKAQRARTYSQEERQALRERALKNHLGWPSRKQPSFGERFTMTFLEERGISFKREEIVDRYYIDFALGDVALEIDGKQHQWPERREHDAKRDKLLESLGWVVYRVPWESVRSESGKMRMRAKLEEFVQWYECRRSSVSRTPPS